MSSALIQQLLVGAVVILAGGYLAVLAIRSLRAFRRRRAVACGNSCGCEHGGPASPRP